MHASRLLGLPKLNLMREIYLCGARFPGFLSGLSSLGGQRERRGVFPDVALCRKCSIWESLCLCLCLWFVVKRKGGSVPRFLRVHNVLPPVGVGRQGCCLFVCLSSCGLFVLNLCIFSSVGDGSI